MRFHFLTPTIMNTAPLNKEELIIRLLIEDYRFQQVIHGMAKIHFHFDQSLDLMSVIAELIHGSDQEPDLLWLHAYAEGLEEAYKLDFWNEKALRQVAEASFERLNSRFLP